MTDGTGRITGWVERVTEQAINVRLEDEYGDQSGTTTWIPKSVIISDADGEREGSVIIELPGWFNRKNRIPTYGRLTNRRNFAAAIN